jgi:hypothetical protein
MKPRPALFWILVAIGAITVASGLLQVIAPGLVLRVVGAEVTPTTMHFFGIVGMFMTLFGGLLLHALFSQAHHPAMVFWASLQKFGASAAVGFGVLHQIFASLALLVAGFDFLSGLLALWYWSRIRSTA